MSMYRHIQDSESGLGGCAEHFPQWLLFPLIGGTSLNDRSHFQQAFQRLGLLDSHYNSLTADGLNWITHNKTYWHFKPFSTFYLQFLALLSFIETLILLFCWASENYWTEKYTISAVCNYLINYSNSQWNVFYMWDINLLKI